MEKNQVEWGDKLDQEKQMQELIVSVKEMAVNMQSMLQELQSQGKRLQRLEDEPKAKWKIVSNTALSTIIGAAAGALGTVLFKVIANNL